MPHDSSPNARHTVLGRVRLREPLPPARASARAAQWRGAVGALFADDPDFHGHVQGGTAMRFPPVQYRWLDEAPALWALGDAANRAMSFPWTAQTLRLGTDEVAIDGVQWEVAPVAIAPSTKLLRYAFGAPWMALSQENYARFQHLSPTQRRAELDRILVGNLLMLGRALGWTQEGTLFAAFEQVSELAVPLKDVTLRAFSGRFVVNLSLPDHLALGRSVSHGYGWFVRD